jgi:NADPH:quinone reductase-like Zn-dependent oxidoreductase
LGHAIRVVLTAKMATHSAVFFIAKPNGDDLAVLRELIEAGQVRPAIDQSFDLDHIAEAMREMDGHARAKIVVTI